MRHFISISILLFVICEASAQGVPELVTVAGGSFTMGDSRGDGEPDERPLHRVTIGSFRIAKTEVTVLQWRQFCSATKRAMPDTPAWGWKNNHPIVSVSWEDATAYCAWLSSQTGQQYRLPTEAEWEYAARGGAATRGLLYSGSNNLNEVGWYRENSGDSTHPVGSKKPNELGLYDMSGNVFEWCQDYLDEYHSAPVHNPSGPERGTFVLRRGGSWDDPATRNRVSYRAGNSFRRSYHSLGFRVAANP